LYRLLNDDAMGGGKSGGHAMVVALHLYKLLKSSRKFTELMTKNFETTIKGVDCLIPFNDQLKVHYNMLNIGFFIGKADYNVYTISCVHVHVCISGASTD
jgi:hypothetical protein